ncbi:MAG: DUF58 domain-containing protein, partial [Myxococcota bacterium]|nr:DUF58 domain-containing protein [Myxococcota bacterium]
HKEYSPGDETKHIDWKAYGRMDKYYVKRFEQETNLNAWCVLDQSGSMAYGAEGALTKFDYASVVAASLGFLLLSQQDAVGVLTFSDGVQKIIPTRSGLGHMSHICAALEGSRPEERTDLSAGLRQLSEQTRRRGVVMVFTDFFAPLEEAFGVLRQLVSRGHQVIAFHVLDGDELRFPFEEMTLFEGLETGDRLLAEPRSIRSTYMKRIEAHVEEVRRRCIEGRIEPVLLDTSEPPARVLLRVLRRLQNGSVRS